MVTLLKNINRFPLRSHYTISSSSALNIYQRLFNTSTDQIVSSSNIIQAKYTQNRKDRRKARRNKVDPTSAEGVLLHELEGFSQKYQLNNVSQEVIRHYLNKENHEIVDNLEILEINSNGQGIGIEKTNFIPIVVPFVTKGDIVQIRLGRHNEVYAEGHLLKVIKASNTRRDDLIKCEYFSKCSGCQFQMLSYPDQLNLKTQTVKNAFKRFGFDTDVLPILPTIGSPMEYSYRTKLTPHFTSNRKNIMIGFEKAGQGQGMLSVESCEIATPVLSQALTKDRTDLENIVRSYKKGGTILLRDTSYNDKSTYTTNHRDIVTQRVNGFDFQFPAGEFFQNNNSILPSLLETIRGYINPSKHKTLVDTYCGSGFFGISLSDSIENLIGIEVSKGNLEFAQQNAKLNNIQNSKFILGSSEEIFKDLKETNPDQTIVILDPPRKGSTHEYLSQLSEFRPNLIVYISCNVFTQARDLEFFIASTSNGSQYKVNTVGGYDFFPQTRHVESLAILELNETAS